MPYLPLHIDVSGMTILVVGGGAVAERKIIVLLAAGATVNVIAPEIAPRINQLAAHGALQLKKRHYVPDDLNGIFLAVAATNDPQVNRQIAADARQNGILVSVADAPETGNCTFPAVLRRGDLGISVSTNGTYPGFAVEIRNILASVIGEEYGTLLETLAIEREKLLTEECWNTYNNQVLRSRARELINGLFEHKERVP